jgi:hypothetical protein
MRITAIKCETAAGFALPAVAAATAHGTHREIRAARLSLPRATEKKMRQADFSIVHCAPVATGHCAPVATGHCAAVATAAPRAAVLLMSFALMLAACAPTYAPHIDAPAMPALEPQPSPTQCQHADLNTEKERIAALDPPPQLPDTDRSPCPAGSGLAACFTAEQDAIRQRRFKILHDDRDYCRDAYGRAAARVGGGASK